MKIVQIARRFAPKDWGGTETVILQTSRELMARGHEVELYCTLATANVHDEQVSGLRVRRFPYFYPYIGLSKDAERVLDKKGGSPFSFALLRALKTCPEIDLIHLHVGNRIGGIGRREAIRRGIPYVISLHGGLADVPAEEAATWTAPAKGALEWGKILGWWVGSRRLHEDAAALICVGQSEQVAAQKRFPRKRVIYIPNGVDTERFQVGDGKGFRIRRRIPTDAWILLQVARVDVQKNQLFLIKQMPEILRRVPNAYLVLIGAVANPEYERQIRTEVTKLGVSEKIVLIPGLDWDSQDLVDAYHAANLFVLPSIHEPFGIVILEAWSAGLPVLASRVGGIPFFVEQGETGMLFNVKESRGFLESLGALHDEPGMARKLGSNGRRQAREQFSWSAVTDKLISIYEEVLRENSVRQ